MANFYQKNQQTDAKPGNFLTRDAGNEQSAAPPPRSLSNDGATKKIPIVGATAPGETVPVGIGYGNPDGLTPDDFEQPQPGRDTPTFSNEPTAVDKVSEILANSSLAGHPAYRQLMESRAKLTALRTMPTYTNKRGETVQGMKDRDGRVQSGLKGLFAGLAQMGPARNEQELYAGLTNAIGRGIGGAIVPEWNEWADRSREMKRLEDEQQNLAKQLEFDSKLMTQEVGRLDKFADNQRDAEKFKTRTEQQNRALDIRASRAKVQNLKDEQRTALDPILKRGYYYEGDNPDEDAKLQKLGIILPDYDTTRKSISNNGKRLAWNPDKREYEQAEGTDIDPDDEPITFMVDGEKVTTSRKYFVNYKAQKERQESQQSFTATENDKNRALRKQLQDAQQQFGREQTITKAVDAWSKLYFREKGKMPPPEMVTQYKSYVEQNLDSPDQQ